MEFGDALQKRMEELAKRQPMVQRRLREISKGATLRAVEEAMERTPPNTCKGEDGEIRGQHTITGELAQHWSTDSQTVPIQTGSQFTTTLANDQEYASYVNDGHWVIDVHTGKPRFVPGLYIDEEGSLVYDEERKKEVGILVGTKTQKAKGLYIKEAGVEKFKEVAESELRKLPGEMFQ